MNPSKAEMSPGAERYSTIAENSAEFSDVTYKETEEFTDHLFIHIWKCLNSQSTANLSLDNNGSCFNGDISSHLGIHGDSSEYDVLKLPAYAVSVMICYIIVISIGALGNAMVVLTVIKAKKMWNATNIFIANLAVADIFVCVFDLPLSAYYQITGQWIFGATLCRVIPMIFAMVVYSSTLTLTMIATDRFILVVYPLKARLTPAAAFILIFVIIAFSCAVALPIALYGRLEIYEDKTLNIYRKLCYEDWPTQFHRRLYTKLTVLFQYFVPLIVIAVLYVRIFLRIRYRITRGRCSRRTKTTKMLVAVVTVFAVAWTPYHIHSLLSEYGRNPFGIYYNFVDAILRVLAMSSSCLNPLFYGWLNDNYKNAFLSLIRKPAQIPNDIHREESDRTVSRSNAYQGSQASQTSPKQGSRKNHQNCTEVKSNCNSFLAPPERVPLHKLKAKGMQDGTKYNSIAHIGNDPRSPVKIIVTNESEMEPTQIINNNIVQ